MGREFEPTPVREDPKVPVAAEDLKRLPINPQTKKFDKLAFVYDADADCFHCPAGKTLSRSGQETRQTASGPVLHASISGTNAMAANWPLSVAKLRTGRTVAR